VFLLPTTTGRTGSRPIPVLEIAVLATLAVAFLAAGTVLGPIAAAGQSSYVRSLAGRGLVFAVAFAVLGGMCAAGLRAVGRPGAIARSLVLGAVAGVAFHLGLTLWLAWRYDASLLNKQAAMNARKGVVTFQVPGRAAVSIRPVVGDTYQVVGTLDSVTDAEIHLLCAAEDERCLERQVNIDAEAYGRGIWTAALAALSGRGGRLPGVSDLSGQVAGLMLGLKPSGSGWRMWREKAEKILAAFRVDDLFSRREQARIYLSLCSFGAVQGREVVGLPAAAEAFYGREHDQLAPAQLAELMARLRNPSPGQYFPYRRRQESESDFAHRLRRLELRTAAILDVAHRQNWLAEEERERGKDEFLAGLHEEAEAGRRVTLPHWIPLWRTIQATVPDLPSRHLEARIAADPDVQTILKLAASDAVEEMRLRARRADRVVVDASVVDPEGGVVAEIGLATERGGMASHIKPEIYGLGVEIRTLASLELAVRRRGRPAWYALAHSTNEDALALAERIGLPRLITHLRSQGYTVTGPFTPVVLGAGVTGSPRLVAGNYAKFGYSHPGRRVEPSYLVSISDAATGEKLFAPRTAAVFSPSTASSVRAALERTSTSGTAAAALRALASASPIATKTGTAGFHRRGRWQGEGGSWCVSIDRQTGLTIAVRVRWSSGAPFELEGGRSAAFVVRNFLAAARRQRTGN
jgi:membrane peptidoglycan carboxypeptidase